MELNITDTTYRNEPLERWMKTIGNHDIMSDEEVLSTIKECKSGNKKALNKLVSNYQRFLFAAARTYSRDGNIVMELIQEGNIGLILAINKYDISRGVAFISFAVHYIRKYMSAYISNSSLVKHNIDNDILSFVKEIKKKWFDENGFTIPNQVLRELASEKFGREFRLNGEYLFDTDVRLASELLSDDDENDGYDPFDGMVSSKNGVEAVLENEDFSKIARNIIKNVCHTDMETNIIVYSYGLSGKPEISDYEIGLKYAINENQVYYLRKKIIERMKDFVNGKKKKKFNVSKFQTY